MNNQNENKNANIKYDHNEEKHANKFRTNDNNSEHNL